MPIESVVKDRKLIDYLKLIQKKENVLIGIQDHVYGSLQENARFGPTERRIQKGIDVFKEADLKPSWIISQSLENNNAFFYVAKSFGYKEKNYILESRAKEKENFKIAVLPQALEKMNNFELKEKPLVFKEYTEGWGIENFGDYGIAVTILNQDMKTSVQGILLSAEDFNSKTEEFIKYAAEKYQEIKFIKVKDIKSSQDIANLKKLIQIADKNNKMLLAGVNPTYKISAVNPLVSNAIKITWFVFIPFFLFPLVFMVFLHWHERKKIRKNARNEPMLSAKLPRVSLIFPAYNEEKLIRKTIEQGLCQDYQGELEIVIIDDGSTDRTFQIASEYALKYPNVVVQKHEKNMGKPEGLNTGFKIATGEISVFSDSDSHLAPDLVSKMIPHFEDPEVGVVAGMIVIDNEINLLTKLQQVEYLYNQEIVRFCQTTHKGVLICPGAATAVRTRIARDIPSTERTITEDADFTFEAAQKGWKITQEPEAISWTEAPEDIKEFINQRKRWLYGVLQTIWIHKWALFFKGTKVPNLWVWWTWVGYITCPITTISVILMPFLYHVLGTSYLIFLFWYSLIVFALYGLATWYGLKQYAHEKKTKLIFLFPAYLVYQYLLNVLLFYLIVVFVIRKGVVVRYGGRDIHAV